ncbi:unnamed protein product [Pieris brassicae]|uniref:Uncharacterized protein n=1 Tax=Pieris brassicae TaxID=7116 RepID=A0A9P0X6X7_PIEBR|nr:unnamed protein product [Pieris brassicae]
MSDIFHKSCYTTRTTGYKYRTLSTNTGEKPSKENKETNVFDRKFKELKNAITSRINKEVHDTQTARINIDEKFDKVNSKINTMLDLKDTITMLRKDLQTAEDVLCNMVERVEKLESMLVVSEASSFQSHNSFMRVNSYQNY